MGSMGEGLCRTVRAYISYGSIFILGPNLIYHKQLIKLRLIKRAIKNRNVIYKV